MAGTYKYGHVVGVRRGKSVQQSEDISKSQDTELAVEQARKWIEVSMTSGACSHNKYITCRNAQKNLNKMYHFGSLLKMEHYFASE